MSHPSATLRGKIVTVPLAGDDRVLVQAAVDALRRAHPDALALVTVSERNGGEPRVLTVSGRRQRSLRQWRSLLDAPLTALGAVLEWDRGLVLMARAETRHGI